MNQLDLLNNISSQVQDGIRTETVFRRFFTFPADITNYDFKMDIRDEAGGLIISLTKTNSRIVITDGPGGKFNLILTGAETTGLTLGRFKYDLLYDDNSGAGWEFAWNGLIDISPTVTQP